MGMFRTLEGQRFGRLTVLSEYESRLNRTGKAKEMFWLCRCDCGKEVYIRADSLRRGKTRSCGCLNDEERRKPKGRAKRFNYEPRSGTRLYNIYTSMHHRCNNKSNKTYGAKGIRICDEWLDYEVFKKWALSNGYSDNLSIDRIDNNKGYSPENCRWVDRKTQANNMTTNHKVTYKGQTKNLNQWAEEVGIERSTIGYRLKSGWTVEEALEKIPRYGNRRSL